MTQLAQEKASYFVRNFEFLDSWEEKYQYVIDLGKSLPMMADEDKIEENRVEGCMSQVWLRIDIFAQKVQIHADSDALIVRGLIALVRTIVDGQSPQDVVAFDFVGFFQRLGLDRQLSPNRRNGLVAFVQRVQDLVR